MAEQMAHDFRLPIIRVIEGSGGGGSVKTIETKGAANLPGGIGGTEWYWFTTANLARVPVVGLGLGSVAGLGGTGAGIGSMIFTLTTGWVVDNFSYTPILVAAGLLAPIGTIVLFALVGKIQRVPLKN